MTMEELRQTDWYKERPEIIKQAIEIVPPIQKYKIKTTGKQCYLISYEEPESNRLEDVTITVQKIGVGGWLSELGLAFLDTNRVFGLSLNDLEPINEI